MPILVVSDPDTSKRHDHLRWHTVNLRIRQDRTPFVICWAVASDAELPDLTLDHFTMDKRAIWTITDHGRATDVEAWMRLRAVLPEVTG